MTDPLDTMLDTLRTDVPEMSDQAFAAGRARVQAVDDPIPVTTTPEPDAVVVALPKQPALRSPPRRALRLVASAAAVVALAAGVVAVQSGDDQAPVAAAAALNTAADNVTITDPALEPGQYRYIATHSWYMNSGTDYAVLVEQLHEKWIPRDWRDEWLLRREPTGNLTWVYGSAEDATMDPLDVYPRDEFRGPCGDYHFAEEGREPCTLVGSWQVPTPYFLADLPRDPAALYQRLREDVGTGGDTSVVGYVEDVLRSGQVPADLRASLYRALAMVPGLEIAEDVANLDGKQGKAFGIDEGEFRHELIIDPATGEYIGEREVLIETWDGVPAGTVVGFTAVSASVADAIGEKPAS